jgi:drug/metabolite transporter (DMT)-like permease
VKRDSDSGFEPAGEFPAAPPEVAPHEAASSACEASEGADGALRRGIVETPEFATVTASPVPTLSGAQSTAIAPARSRLGRQRLYTLGAHSRARWQAAPDNLRGSALLVLSIAVFSAMMAAIKAIGTNLPLTEILLIRQAMLTLLILPFFKEDLAAAFRTGHLGLQLLRGLFALGSQFTYFLALLYLPLAEMTALGFSQVIFMTLTAVIVLKETVGLRRWLATGVAFIGVLIMLRPTDAALDPYALLAILSAILLCGVTVFIRLMAATESTASLLLYQSAVLCAAYLGPAVIWWEWPSAIEWTLLLVIGIAGTIGQYLFTVAFKIAETSALAPLEFTRLLIAIIVGYLIFAEVPDVTTMFGALIVVGSTIYTVRRNAAADTRAVAGKVGAGESKKAVPPCDTDPGAV